MSAAPTNAAAQAQARERGTLPASKEETRSGETYTAPPAHGNIGAGGGCYPQSSLYLIDVGCALGREYVPLFEDIFRMICIQFTIQLMLYFSGAASGVFTLELVCIIAYVVLGVMLYWLVFRALVSFR